MPRPRARRRERRSIPQGRAYIYSTFNNTLVSLTDPDGNVVASTSAGTAGFRGSRKGTAFAAQRAAEQAARRGVDMGMRNIDVYIKGPGSGREPAIRALQAAGLNVSSIRDVTPIPHNGVRPSQAPPRLNFATPLYTPLTERPTWADIPDHPAACAAAPAKSSS